MIQIHLNENPVGKARARIVKGKSGKIWGYTPSSSKGFNNALQAEAIKVMQGKKPLQGALKVTVRAWLEIPKSWSKKKVKQVLNGELIPTQKPDLDNIIKQLDALNGIVFKDDCQIMEIKARKDYGLNPALHITIENYHH